MTSKLFEINLIKLIKINLRKSVENILTKFTSEYTHQNQSYYVQTRGYGSPGRGGIEPPQGGWTGGFQFSLIISEFFSRARAD